MLNRPEVLIHPYFYSRVTDIAGGRRAYVVYLFFPYVRIAYCLRILHGLNRLPRVSRITLDCDAKEPDDSGWPEIPDVLSGTAYSIRSR